MSAYTKAIAMLFIKKGVFYMNTTKRVLCMLLVLVMLVCAFAGCTEKPNSNDPKDTDETTGNDDGTKDDESDDDEESTVPEDIDTSHLNESYMWEDKIQEYRILSRSSTAYEFESPDTGTLSGVQQAVFNRNSTVEERCNIEITVIPQAGDWVAVPGNSEFMQTVRNNGKLDNSAYELIATHQAYLVNLAVEGYGWDFAELPGVDLTKRWWSAAFYETANYNGAQYVAYGDIAYTLYSYMMVVFFNSQVAEDYGIDEDFYDLALDGDWTFEKMKTYTQMVTTDLEAAEEDREYGFVTNGHSIRNFSCGGFEIDLIPVKTDGMRETKPTNFKLSVDAEQKLQSVADFLQETNQVYCVFSGNNGAEEGNNIFKSGRALFYTQMLGEAVVFKETLRDSYGVMPLPKYDDNQKNYHTGVRDTVTGILVPYNVRLSDMAGIVVEMLSMESFFEVTEAYYEDTIKYKSFNDPKCVASLELIRKSFDPAWELAYSNCINTCYSLISNLVETNISKGTDNQVATYFSSTASAWPRSVRDLYTALDKIAADRAAA